MGKEWKAMFCFNIYDRVLDIKGMASNCVFSCIFGFASLFCSTKTHVPSVQEPA
jgi:hypothetical protein